MLVLRTCNSDLTSKWDGKFKYPEKGWVETPDWDPKPECGKGLHGLLGGMGCSILLDWSKNAKWLVIETDSVVDIDGAKVKFKGGNVVYCGDRKGATDYLLQHGDPHAPVHGCYKMGGNNVVLTGGNDSILTGGDFSTLTGGSGSTLTGGYGSILTGGDYSTLTGGYGSILTSGNSSTLTGGNRSTLTGGEKSVLNWKWWDGKRYRITIKYIGEDGIKPNVKYKCISGKVEEVNETSSK